MGVELALVFLGTSAAVPTKERGLPCIALVYRGRAVLMDVGEGCQYRLLAAGISPLSVEAILVTHMHGDHFFGLPGLLQSMAMHGRSRRLVLVGPEPLLGFVKESLRATRHNPGYVIEFYAAKPGLELSAAGLQVKAFPVDHGVEAYGYTVSAPAKKKLRVEVLREKYGLSPGPYAKKLLEGKPVRLGGTVIQPGEVVYTQYGPRIVYTGDTRPSETVAREARGATILVHDSTFTLDMRSEALEQGHSTAWDAAVTARKAGVKLLVLTHISARYRDPAPLLEEAMRVFPSTVVAEDYMKILLR